MPYAGTMWVQVTHRQLPFDPKMSVMFDVRTLEVVPKKEAGRGRRKPSAKTADLDTKATGTTAAAAGVSEEGQAWPWPTYAGGPFLESLLQEILPADATNAASSTQRLSDLYTVQLTPYAWTLLPVFDVRGEGYVQRGAFRLPLLRGPVPREVLAALVRGRGPKPGATKPYPLEILQR